MERGFSCHDPRFQSSVSHNDAVRVLALLPPCEGSFLLEGTVGPAERPSSCALTDLPNDTRYRKFTLVFLRLTCAGIPSSATRDRRSQGSPGGAPDPSQGKRNENAEAAGSASRAASFPG